jgi:hypothetical protein
MHFIPYLMDPSPSSKSIHYQVFKMFVPIRYRSPLTEPVWRQTIAGGTFLSLIPLLTEAEAPFLCLLHSLAHSKFTRDIMGYFRPRAKNGIINS